MGSSYKVEILAQEVIAKLWSTLSKVTLKYTRRDGRSEILVREVNDHGHAAAVLALDPARKTVSWSNRCALPPMWRDTGMP